MEKSLKEEIKYLQGKLDENPDSLLFARLSDAYLQSDRIDDAIEICEKGIKKHPYYVTGHYVLGKCYLKKKLFDQAEKELKRVLLFDPKYIAAHRDYAELMAQIGWNNTCEMSYEEIIRIDPLNEKAKDRLKILKEQMASSKEEPTGADIVSELEEVEKNILTEVASDTYEKPSLSKEPTEPIPATSSFASQHIRETNEFLEEEKASLDLLEDIFRDDNIPDSTLNEDFSPKMNQESISTGTKELDVIDDQYFWGNDLEEEVVQQLEKKEFDGIDVDEVFNVADEGIQDQRSELNILSGPLTPQSSDKIEPKMEPLRDKKPRTLEQESLQAAKKDLAVETEASDRKKEKIVTPTLGEIYAAQRQYVKAIGVYEILRKKDPQNEFYKQKIEYLQKKLEESQAD